MTASGGWENHWESSSSGSRSSQCANSPTEVAMESLDLDKSDNSCFAIVEETTAALQRFPNNLTPTLPTAMNGID